MWLLDNPNCSGAADWEKLSYKICKGLGIEATLTKQKQCDITFDISRKIIPCELLYIINVANKACSLGYEIKRNKEECKLDWKLLIEKTNCDLTLNQYNSLINQGMTYDMMLYVYNSGCSLDVNGNECCVKTTRGTAYTFNELDLRKIPDPSNLSVGEIQCSIMSLEQYINDYKLNKQQLNSLQNG